MKGNSNRKKKLQKIADFVGNINFIKRSKETGFRRYSTVNSKEKTHEGALFQ